MTAANKTTDTRTRLARLWRDQLGLDGDFSHGDIPDETRFDANGDSFDQIELCMAIEDEFAIVITDIEWHDNATTFGDLLTFVTRQLAVTQ